MCQKPDREGGPRLRVVPLLTRGLLTRCFRSVRSEMFIEPVVLG
jgi:hypothetical protein